MKIKELENLLSISRSNIRFYEKKGLFCPERKDNNYREYSVSDINKLKKIIILRKMGFTVEEISLVQKGDLSFEDALNTTQTRLESEIEQLNGSLKMVKQISKKHPSFNEIDVEKFWDAINQSENVGEKFIDICKDYLELELNAFDNMWKFAFFHDFKKSRAKHGVIKACVILLIICFLRGLGNVFIWHESFWSGFLYPWLIAVVGSIIILPLFILSKRFPKIASIICSIFLGIIVLFFMAIIFLVLYSIIKSIIN